MPAHSRQTTSCLIALLVLLPACAPEFGDGEGRGRIRQELGTSWTLWSGSGSNATIATAPGVNGHYNDGGSPLYVGRADAGVESGPVASAVSGYTGISASPKQVSARAAVAQTDTACQIVGWRDVSGGTLAWGVESWVSSSCQLTTINTLSGAIDSAPAIASYLRSNGGTEHHYWVFAARASDGALLYNHFVGTSATSGSWDGWAAKTDTVLRSGSSVAVISRDVSSVDIFAMGTNDVLYTRNLAVTYPGGTQTLTWTSWTDLGMSLSSDPAVGSKSSSHMTVCGNGGDDVPYCKDYSGGSWNMGYRSCGGTLNAAPGVTTDGTDVWVLGRGFDNKLYARTCN